ncbi:hypothetical protein [Devosia sp. Root436]|uniref:hypothetical protein n=1 Tax=Devosia sp. Root436 TaxID=1736537 RepID=UPI000A41E54E|nr:hypothetical protein [Devosia sp. Root436]
MTAKSSNTKKPVPSTIRRLNEETEGIADEDLKDFVDLLATNIRTTCRRLEIEIPTPAGRPRHLRPLA